MNATVTKRVARAAGGTSNILAPDFPLVAMNETHAQEARRLYDAGFVIEANNVQVALHMGRVDALMFVSAASQKRDRIVYDSENSPTYDALVAEFLITAPTGETLEWNFIKLTANPANVDTSKVIPRFRPWRSDRQPARRAGREGCCPEVPNSEPACSWARNRCRE